MRLTPDDEIYRVRLVWLGPIGVTFPWVARYLAYGVWLATFTAILLFEAVTPLSVGLPVWELVLTTLFTYALLGFIDHEKPLKAVLQTFRADLTAPRPAKPTITAYRIRTTKWIWYQKRLGKVIR